MQKIKKIYNTIVRCFAEKKIVDQNKKKMQPYLLRNV